MVASLPELIDAYHADFNITEENEEINHRSASLYNTIISLAEMAGSLIAGMLYDEFGYR